MFKEDRIELSFGVDSAKGCHSGSVFMSLAVCCAEALEELRIETSFGVDHAKGLHSMLVSPAICCAPFAGNTDISMGVAKASGFHPGFVFVSSVIFCAVFGEAKTDISLIAETASGFHAGVVFVPVAFGSCSQYSDVEKADIARRDSLLSGWRKSGVNCNERLSELFVRFLSSVVALPDEREELN